MKAFFTNMSLARIIILLSIPGAIYLAWAGQERSAELDELNAAYRVQIPKVVREIQELSKLNTKLHKDIKDNIYINQDSPGSYARYCADNQSVQIGDVAINPSSRPAPGGVLDNKLAVRPEDPKRAFTHAQIAAFLYRLEADSNQIKVTDLKYSLLGKGIKDDTIPADEWTFDVTITNRVKDPSKSKPNAPRS